MDDNFAVVLFLHHQKSSYPKLFALCRRVYATPVSSCSSERVFSTVNRIVSKDGASLSPKTLEKIVVLRSMNDVHEDERI